MPTSNKTTNLNLNNWLSTDKPKRTDFTENNEIIDAAIYNHTSNSTIHISSQERAKIEAPFIFTTLNGDGNASKSHTLSITPKMVIVFLPDEPLNEYDSVNGYNICNGGIVYTNFYGSTPGISLNGSTLTLYQTQSTPDDGIFKNLNQSSKQYLCIAFK